jgi:MurNAc alpha-1-phosphate uridylyltransferase
LTNTTPKPLLPVKGIPLILRLVEKLRLAGVSEVVVNTYHLGSQIEALLGDGVNLGVSVSYSREQTLLETGGGIKLALPLLADDTFILCNADIYSDFAFEDLPKNLLPEDLAHLVLVPTPSSREAGDFSYLAGRVTARGGDFVYSGIAILHRHLFRDSPDGPFSLRDLLFQATAQGRVSAQVHDGSWSDIGTHEDYAAVNAEEN